MYRAVFFLTCITAIAAPALGQTGATGAIAGMVRDQTGAARPGRAKSPSATLATNETRQVTTPDRTARSSCPLLPPGDYALEVRMGGFAPLTRDGIRVTVTETTNLTIELQLEGVTDTVQVSAAHRDRPVDIQHARPRRRLAGRRGAAARHAQLHADHRPVAGHHDRRDRRRRARPRDRRHVAAQRARQSLVRQQLPDERPRRQRHLLAGHDQRRRADSESRHDHRVQGPDRPVRRRLSAATPAPTSTW